MKVVIVGAGLAGLAAATALRRGGHVVSILERSFFKQETGAAINVPPNASRFLSRWGLDSSTFVESRGMSFMSPANEEWSFFDHSNNVKRYGGPLWYAHREDLHRALRAMATAPDGHGTPVKIHLGCAVKSYVSPWCREVG
jgi:salicylate hydroxylase